jgi:hypothetical protein
MLDPDPDSSQSGSTTLVEAASAHDHLESQISKVFSSKSIAMRLGLIMHMTRIVMALLSVANHLRNGRYYKCTWPLGIS